jgi:hypothetical protein
MPTESARITAAEVMDRSAVLLNDPAKTDYTYPVLTPFLRMALDELTETLIDGQNSPTVQTTLVPITIPAGTLGVFDMEYTPGVITYPSNLVEIQEISERAAGSNEPFVPMKRMEFIVSSTPQDMLRYWAWESQIIRFNPNGGATTAREIQIKHLKEFGEAVLTPESIVGSMNSRSYLSYKTASFAAMFIGENPERAVVLEYL